MLMHTLEACDDSAATGFLELVYSHGEFLDSEFQELIGRIDPPARTPGRFALPDGWQSVSPIGDAHRPREIRHYGNRTPPPARERSPP
jgi:hypothetical protein